MNPRGGLVVAAWMLAAGCSHAAEVPSATAAPAPAVVVTDIAHWKHPTKAVFARYRVTLQSVTVQDRRATFRVAFPFDPQTGPNAARLQAFCLALLKANGSWAYALVSADDHLEIDVAWDQRAGRIDIDNHSV